MVLHFSKFVMGTAIIENKKEGKRKRKRNNKGNHKIVKHHNLCSYMV